MNKGGRFSRLARIFSRHKTSVFITGFYFTALFFYAYYFTPEDWGGDWLETFRPALFQIISGNSPYIKTATYHPNTGYFNPPWFLLPLLPVALLPPRLSAAIMYALNCVGYGLIAYRLGARPYLAFLFSLSPFVLWSAYLRQLDWLAAAGILMPPKIGLMFLLSKPQAGGAVALFILIRSYRSGGIKEVGRVAAPVIALYAVSFMSYGLWPLQSFGLSDAGWNYSLWPWGIPVGILIIGLSVYKNEKSISQSASPLLSPYVGITSWPVMVLAFSRRHKLFALAILASIVLFNYAS